MKFKKLKKGNAKLYLLHKSKTLRLKLNLGKYIDFDFNTHILQIKLGWFLSTKKITTNLSHCFKSKLFHNILFGSANQSIMFSGGGGSRDQ